jgi:hypothetical protein
MLVYIIHIIVWDLNFTNIFLDMLLYKEKM